MRLRAMSDDSILAAIEQQDWLAPVQKAMETTVKQTYASAGEAGQVVKNAMHGVWLGHPLHSAITDVPIGSWTAAAVLDLLEASGKDEYAAGADAAVVVGLAGAVASAAAGLTDLSEVHGKPQRVGALHGLINFAATALYGASWAARRADRRSLGRTLAFAGYGLVAAGAYLGGAISYRQRIGVDHAPDAENELPKDFTKVMAADQLPEGKPVKATVDGTDIFLLKRGEQIYGLANNCSHLGGPLSEGEVEGDSVRCPWHGSRFCLKNGEVLDGPAVHPQPALDVVVRDGQIEVRVSQSSRTPANTGR
jgi:nitrite reductase/ring-hydroxylating ferredoxin subunit/uncharacterized membrane protein